MFSPLLKNHFRFQFFLPFIEGWLYDAKDDKGEKQKKAWGRPVDVLILNDGSMLISDDFAGCIYRVTYTDF